MLPIPNSSIPSPAFAIPQFSRDSCLTFNQSTSPVIDGDFYRESPTLQLQAGSFVKVPLLIGANQDEGTAFGPRGINTTGEVAEYIQNSYTTDNSSINTLLVLYPDIPEIGIPGTFHGRPGADLGLQYKRTSGRLLPSQVFKGTNSMPALVGDFSMHAPRRAASQAWLAHNVTCYSYVFNVLVNGQPSSIGSTHFQEGKFISMSICYFLRQELGARSEGAAAGAVAAPNRPRQLPKQLDGSELS